VNQDGIAITEDVYGGNLTTTEDLLEQGLLKYQLFTKSNSEESVGIDVDVERGSSLTIEVPILKTPVKTKLVLTLLFCPPQD
jgi:hypothetical protein